VSDPLLVLRRAADRFRTSVPGVETAHVFSFGPHYDPDHVGHGPLMVLNEESLQVGRGFDDHPHADAEILTWVAEGSLVHADSTGHRGVVVPGLAQRLSAGSGVVHAERNDAHAEDPTRPPAPARFVQMWLRPDEPGLPPSYGQGEVESAALSADWVPVAAGGHRDAAVTLGSAGSTLWVTVLATGAARLLPVGALAHLFVLRGSVDLEAVGTLEAGDSLRVSGEAALRATARTEAEVLVWTFTA
jgi:redox-sensitive bicupin YhaK (pirin superfamily)